MNIWKILGIEPTKDKDELKTAYRNRLMGVNPEDDAEGFMELLKAYEEALKLAKTDSDNSFGNSIDGDIENVPEEMGDNPESLYNQEMKKLNKDIDELYNDFSKRIDINCWEEMLNRDDFIALDTSEVSLKVLLNYLMDHFLLPQNIWKLIIDTFYIKDRKSELCEKYPRDFIDFIIDNSDNVNSINYFLFEDDVDSDSVDEFLKTYITLNSDIRRGDFDEADEKIHKLEESEIYHPYIELAKIRVNLYKLNPDEDTDEIKKLYQNVQELALDFSDDFNIYVQCGDIAVILKEFDA
ncbi:MAG: J domain-containing protein, partial [Lachnospiraceae bacterium]|nr:J domain-containing protein [Lachnospiraceae bacterium]